MLNIADTEIVALRQKSIELALQMPTNSPANAANATTLKVLDDAKYIFDWIVKDKESAPQ